MYKLQYVSKSLVSAMQSLVKVCKNQCTKQLKLDLDMNSELTRHTTLFLVYCPPPDSIAVH